MKKALFLLLSLTFILISCSENPESYIKYINGYWEIKHVEKDNTLLKEFNISSNVDYFEVNEETLTGFRKKVTPTLEGKFIINKHESPFTLKIEGNDRDFIFKAATLESSTDWITELHKHIGTSEGFL